MTKTPALRWQIVYLLAFVSLVRSVDAVSFSVAAKQIMPEFGLTQVQMGVLYTAFTFGYGLFHVPGGWLGDAVGPRITLAGAILWWSVFTAATAMVSDVPLLGEVAGPFWILFVVRFLVGAGEGAAYPNSSKTISNWVAADERGLASGFIWSGLGLGYAIAPPVVAWIMVHHGWRPAFYLFGVVGIVLSAVWYVFMRDRPEEHPRISREELLKIRGTGATIDAPAEKRGPTPWRQLLTNRNVILLALGALCNGYIVYIYQSWFYIYLVDVRGFSMVTGGLFATGPFLTVTILSPLGGSISDRLTRRFGSKIGRRAVAATAFLLSACCVSLGAIAADPNLAIVLLSLGDGLAYVVLGAAWGAIMDISGEHTGSVYGFVGLCGNLGGMLAPTLTPIIAAAYGWETAIHVAAAMGLAGALLWLAIDAGQKIVVPARQPA